MIARARRWLVCFLLAMPALGHAQSIAGHDEILAEIAAFRSDPGATDAASRLDRIVAFAEASSEVTVEISAEMLPWQPGTIDPSIQNTFVGAFIAGNVEYQLQNNVNQNRPLEGAALVIEVYRMLRADGAVNIIADLEP